MKEQKCFVKKNTEDTNVLMVTQESLVPRVFRNKGELTSEEIQDAEMHIKSIEQNTLKGEYETLKSKEAFLIKNKLLCLKSVLDEDGIKRGVIRLQHTAYLPYDTSKKKLGEKVDC